MRLACDSRLIKSLLAIHNAQISAMSFKITSSHLARTTSRTEIPELRGLIFQLGD